MVIDKELLDNLTAQAKVNPRLRQAMDLRNSAEDLSQRMLNALEPGMVMPIVLNIEKGQWHSLKCLESGTILLEAKDKPYAPLSKDEIFGE